MRQRSTRAQRMCPVPSYPLPSRPTRVTVQDAEGPVHAVIREGLLGQPHHHCRGRQAGREEAPGWQGPEAEALPAPAVQAAGAGRVRQQHSWLPHAGAPQLGLLVSMPSKSGSARGCISRKGRRPRSRSRRTVAVREEKTCTWGGQEGKGEQSPRASELRCKRIMAAPARHALCGDCIPAPPTPPRQPTSRRSMSNPSPCTRPSRLAMESFVVLVTNLTATSAARRRVSASWAPGVAASPTCSVPLRSTSAALMLHAAGGGAAGTLLAKSTSATAH